MDLISRKAAIESLGERPENWTDTPAEIEAVRSYDNAIDDLKSVPAVAAVPLDKLCELLTANRVSIPCRLCEYDDAGECTVQNDMSKPCPNTTRDWRRVITNWMEEPNGTDNP